MTTRMQLAVWISTVGIILTHFQKTCLSTWPPNPEPAFQCKRAHKTLEAHQICDFQDDCPRGEEEIECGYNCDFEDALCQWKDGSTLDTRWFLTDGKAYARQHANGDTRGLTRDHTKSTSDGHFMVISNTNTRDLKAVKKNTKDSDPDAAVLKSPTLQRSSNACKMTFYYIVTERGGWSLFVDKKVKGHAMTHFSLTNTTARYWRRVVVPLGHTADAFQVSIRVSQSKDTNPGVIAVDDIKFRDCHFPEPSTSCNYWSRFQCSNGACVNSYLVCNFADDCGDGSDEEANNAKCSKYNRCDFERGMCSWKQDESTDDFDWSRETGASSSQPEADHTTRSSSGSFIRITGRSRLDGDRAVLLSPVFQKSRNCRMTFYVIMKGTDVDTLNVNVRSGAEESGDTKLSVSAVTGTYWMFQTLSISRNDPFQIFLEGAIGEGPDHYIAIDDISLSPECVFSAQSFTTETPRTTESSTGPCDQTGQWQCLDRSQCIFQYQRCDFEAHCADQSDEADCGACDFDSSTCGWHDVSRGKFAWTHSDIAEHSLVSTNDDVHDTSDTESVVNKAMVIRDAGTKYDRISLMKSPVYGVTEPTCHLFFFFSLGGSGQLSLYLYPDNTTHFESTEFGTRLWHHKTKARFRKAVVDIGSHAAGFVLVFRYLHEHGPLTVAVDDVSFSTSCSRGAPACEFQCHSSDRCVSSSVLCDTAFDCRHGDDEVHCAIYRRLDFERDIGDFIHDANSDFYWKRTSWKHETSAKFPSRDHSHGVSHGYYLAIPTSDIANRRSEKARIESSIFYPSAQKECTLRLFYHNAGDAKGRVQIFTKTFEDGDLVKVWEMKTASTFHWTRAIVKLKATRAFRVVIEGTSEAGYRGGLAIDDVTFTPECVPAPMASLERLPPLIDSGQCLDGKEFSCDFKCKPVEFLCDFTNHCADGTDEAYCPAVCDFENGWCSWMAEKRPTSWQIGLGKLYDLFDRSLDSHDGHFAVAKSQNREGEAKLSSPIFTKAGPMCSFSFWYRTDMDKTSEAIHLKVTLNRKGYDEPLWARRIGPRSSLKSDWMKQSVSLPPCVSKFQVSFHAIFGHRSTNSNVYLDDLGFERCDDEVEGSTDTPCDESSHFKCSDGHCIPRTSLCDLRTDCCDGSDESESSCHSFSRYTFESGFEGWTHGAGYTSHWTVQDGLNQGMPSKGFPLYDQTQASMTGNYLLISDAKPEGIMVTAALVKEMPTSTPFCRVSFWYQRTGMDINSNGLLVKVRTKRERRVVVAKNVTNDTQATKVWLKYSFPIDVSEPYELIFEGTHFARHASRIALDGVVFNPECNLMSPPKSTASATQPPTTAPPVSPDGTRFVPCSSHEFQCVRDGLCIDGKHVCNFHADCPDQSDESPCGTLQECEFNKDKCFWSNSLPGRFTWEISSSHMDGLKTDANGNVGHFIFIHDNGNKSRQLENSALKSPVLGFSSVSCVLRFHYFTRSFLNNTLSLIITSDNGSASTTLWTASRDTNVWTPATVGIGRHDSLFKLSFSVSLVDDFRGFVALDKLMYEDCSLPMSKDVCPDDQFRCEDGGCVHAHHVCDFQADCRDKSDEDSSLCSAFRVFHFQDDLALSVFRNAEKGLLKWDIWNMIKPLTDDALGVDHTTNTANGGFLYTASSSSADSPEEAWLFSPDLTASNESDEGCQVTFFALIPSSAQRLEVGYCLPDEDVPRASFEVSGITGVYGSFWQKVSFRIFETQPFRLAFIGKPGLTRGIVGVDDVIFGHGCVLDGCHGECPQSGPTKWLPAMENGQVLQLRDKGSDKAMGGIWLPIIGGIVGILALVVIATGVAVYVRTLVIKDPVAKWKIPEQKVPKGLGYLAMDDNGSVQGEMFERSSISI